ncbi:MAG: O-antigen ligase family protein [Candidatus Omnitrophota bacterium]
MIRLIKFFDRITYWSIVILPFAMSIAPAPLSMAEGFIIAGFLAKKALKRERLFPATALNLPLALLFIAACLSFINTINTPDSIKGIFKLARYIMIFFVLTEELRDRRHMQRVLISAAAGVMLSSFDAAWQVISGRDFIRGYLPVVNLGMVRATASFKDSNVLGIYLSAIAPLLFGMALYYFKKPKKSAMMALSLIAIAGMLLTYSRPTLLAAYIALFFLAFARRDKRLIVFLVVFTLISPFIVPRAVKDWARDVEYNPLRFMCNDDRIAVYRNSMHMIKDHPFIGVGVNTYMKNYGKYREPVEYRGVVTKDYMYAHNNFIHMAGETGLISLGIFLWLIWFLLAKSMAIYNKLDDGYYKIFSLSLSACLIAFLVNGLTESSLYYSRVAVIFWYLAGITLAFKRFIHADR